MRVVGFDPRDYRIVVLGSALPRAEARDLDLDRFVGPDVVDGPAAFT